MHTLLMTFLALAAEANTSLPPAPHGGSPGLHEPPVAVYADDAFMLPAEYPAPGLFVPLSEPTRPAWPRALRARRPLPPRYPANQQYYQTHRYDPRLRLDYPWHAPRVRPPLLPAPPSRLPGRAYEF